MPTKKTSKKSPVEELFDGISFKDLLTPIAIVAGALIVGGSVLALDLAGDKHQYKEYKQMGQYMWGDDMKRADVESKKQATAGLTVEEKAKLVDPVTEKDHMYGDIDAPITIIEYSDLDCPYCQRAHGVLEDLVENYNGDVVWVYRHFPLTTLHPNARFLAEASECAGAISGERAFWQFVDGYFAGELASDLSNVADITGIAQSDIVACAEGGLYKERIDAHIFDAKETGGRGTPWSIIIGPNDQYQVVNGAQPIEQWEAIIDGMLAE